MFEIGNLYQRDKLLDFIGSKQQQSGIIWNRKVNDTVIITTGGRHTKKVSYSDSLQEDGSWIYTGQGGKGDQNPNSFANSLLTNKEKKVLIFSTREPNSKEVRDRGNYKKLYQFEGLFNVISWSIDIPDQGNRKGDKLIKYTLRPIVEEIDQINFRIHDPLENISIKKFDFKSLRDRVMSDNEQFSKPKPMGLKEYRIRSLQIKKYALLRADGICEKCDNNAPFKNQLGIPFLEVHHIFSLSDDGPDHPINVAAICPNCHREAHFGVTKTKIKNDLSQRIVEKERILSEKIKLESVH
ncbi:HNH endonuclease [Flavobacterium sp. PS2]|uniref:HNH endonuclease n=1 Tax=Flavobacterium sp. PS2 TaxID=3384157 RepID=UPI00390C899E